MLDANDNPPIVSPAGDLHVVELSLTDTAKRLLIEKLNKYLSDPAWELQRDPETKLEDEAFYQQRRQHLGTIIKDTFPPEILDAFRRTIRGEEINPILVRNLPLDDPKRIQAFKTSREVQSFFGLPDMGNKRGQQQREFYYNQAIIAGVYAALELDLHSSVIVSRTIAKHTPGSSIGGGLLHADNGSHFGIFSVLHNHERAPTRFTHIDHVLDEIPDELREQLVFSDSNKSNEDQKFTNVTSDGRYPWMKLMKSNNTPEVLEAFEEYVKRHSVEPVLTQGSMMFFNNKKLLHQSLLGTLEHFPTEFRDQDALVTRRLVSSFGNLPLSR